MVNFEGGKGRVLISLKRTFSPTCEKRSQVRNSILEMIMPELTQDGSRRMGLKNGRKGEEKAERGRGDVLVREDKKRFQREGDN